ESRKLHLIFSPVLSQREPGELVLSWGDHSVPHIWWQQSFKNMRLMHRLVHRLVYRRRFREPDIQPGETPHKLYTRLKDMFFKWIGPAERSVAKVFEVLITEQFRHTLAPEIRVWVKEHGPADGLRAVELVETFMSAWCQKNFPAEPRPRPATRANSLGQLQ
uniref:SCAN box domain-containing protein n=1 Tax=Salarias fasciatus TaxID=181472 RepID=A0A672HR40_SALFA